MRKQLIASGIGLFVVPLALAATTGSKGSAATSAIILSSTSPTPSIGGILLIVGLLALAYLTK